MRIGCPEAAHQARTVRVFGQFALRHGEDPVGARGKAGIVGDQHHGGALLAGEVEHQLDHHGAGLLVEIAGRLVGEQQARLGDHGAGQADALLFAAGQRRRAVVRARSPSPTAASAAAACSRTSASDSSGEAISSARPTLSSAVSDGMR